MPAKTLVSLPEYLGMSFDGVDCEYVDGHIVERAVPNNAHSKLQVRLVRLFEPLERQVPAFTRTEVRTRLRDASYRIPDVAVFYPREPVDEYPEFVPYIAIEILSPADRHVALMEKLREYEAAGVRHIWAVDPESRVLARYERQSLMQVSFFELPEFDFRITPEDLFGASSP
jgi:Uma2 family endonuclease